MPRVAGILFPFFLAASVVGGCQSEPAKSDTPSPPAGEVWLSSEQLAQAHISLAPVEEKILEQTIPAMGRVAFDDTRVEHVLSPVAGRVIRIEAGLGAKVTKGAALAVIDSPDIGSASSDVGKARADMLAAQRNLARQKSLFEQHAASQLDYETSQDNFSKAKAEIERAQQRMHLLHPGEEDTTTQSYTLRSLIAGEVLMRNVNPGMEVVSQYAVGGTSELFTVGTLDRVWIMADVFEMHLDRVKVGARVTVRVVAHADRLFEGVVDWISDTLDATTRTAKVRCVFDNPDRALKPEMYATVSIKVPGKMALAVPRTAVLHMGDQAVAFVNRGKTDGGLVRLTRLPVDIDDGQAEGPVEVRRGLQKGQVVAISGTQILAGMLE